LHKANIMTQTPKPPSLNFLSAGFNAFLFAPIGLDRFGNSLSVVSAFARLDLDPWQEAGRLAILQGDAAVQKLSGMLLKFPEAGVSLSDQLKTAQRLVALLPKSVRTETRRPRFAAFRKIRNKRTIIALFLVSVAVILTSLAFPHP
jgi:hypothetical protein